MRHQKDRHSGLIELSEGLHEALHFRGTQAGRRLIQAEQGRPGDNGPCKLEYALTAGWKFTRENVADTREFEVANDPFGALTRLPEFAAHGRKSQQSRHDAGAPPHMTTHDEIFPDRHVAKDLRRLKRSQQPKFAASLDRVIGRDLPLEKDIAPGRLQESRDDIEQRALACPVGANQSGYRTGQNLEGNCLEYFEAAKAVRYIADFELGCHRAAVAPRRRKRIAADPAEEIMLPNPPGMKITATIRIAANRIG